MSKIGIKLKQGKGIEELKNGIEPNWNPSSIIRDALLSVISDASEKVDRWKTDFASYEIFLL